MIAIDTHAVIWDALSSGKLSRRAKEAIERANEEDGIILCDISLWEIAMLIKKRRLEVAIGYRDFVDLVLNANRYIIQAITPEIVELSVDLPETINKDPADRLIVAAAIVNNAPLITADENIHRSRVELFLACPVFISIPQPSEPG